MSKNRLYYVTAVPEEEANYMEGFFVAEKKKEANKMAKAHWPNSHSIAITRVRLKDKGFMSPIRRLAIKKD